MKLDTERAKIWMLILPWTLSRVLNQKLPGVSSDESIDSHFSGWSNSPSSRMINKVISLVLCQFFLCPEIKRMNRSVVVLSKVYIYIYISRIFQECHIYWLQSSSNHSKHSVLLEEFSGVEPKQWEISLVNVTVTLSESQYVPAEQSGVLQLQVFKQETSVKCVERSQKKL